LVDMARGYLQHKPRTLGSGYELVVVTTPEQLEGGPDGIGGFLRDGTPVSVAVARALAADGARVDVSVGAEGELLSVGRRTRSIPAAVSRALWLRDGGCRVPGCGHKRHLHAHHVKEWAEGGETKLSNLLLVCSTHHRLVHEGRLRISAGEASAGARPSGALRFEIFDELGRAMPWVPTMATERGGLDALEEWLEDEGVSVLAGVSEPRWDGSRLRLGEAVSVMLASPGFG
ncbi:MAG: HNH endonuclease, partial [Myxococcales bacterium]|nr:HNH endonuclease [Myxococcales bacterium]